MANRVQRHIALNTADVDKTREKLTTGQRINNAGDDAAGLFISENLQARRREQMQSLENVQDAMNLLNVVNGQLGEITNMQHRARELLVQAANDTFGTEQRDAIELELDQIASEIDRIGQSDNPFGEGLLFYGSQEFSVQISGDE